MEVFPCVVIRGHTWQVLSIFTLLKVYLLTWINFTPAVGSPQHEKCMVTVRTLPLRSGANVMHACALILICIVDCCHRFV